MAKKVDTSKFKIQNKTIPLKPVCYGCGYLNPGKAARYKCHVQGSCPALPALEPAPTAPAPPSVYIVVNPGSTRFLAWSAIKGWYVTPKLAQAQIFESLILAQGRKDDLLFRGRQASRRIDGSARSLLDFLKRSVVRVLALSPSPVEEPGPLASLDPKLAEIIEDFEEAAGNAFYLKDQGTGESAVLAENTLNQERQNLVDYLVAHVPGAKSGFDEPRPAKQGWVTPHPTSGLPTPVIDDHYVHWLEAYVQFLVPDFKSSTVIKRFKRRASMQQEETAEDDDDL